MKKAAGIFIIVSLAFMVALVLWRRRAGEFANDEHGHFQAVLWQVKQLDTAFNEGVLPAQLARLDDDDDFEVTARKTGLNLGELRHPPGFITSGVQKIFQDYEAEVALALGRTWPYRVLWYIVGLLALLGVGCSLLALRAANRNLEKRVCARTVELEAEVSGHRTAEGKLKASLQSLVAINAVLDAACLITRTDQRGVITYVNDNFCRISGYRRDELIGQNHRLIKSDEHSADFFKEIWQTIAHGRTWRGEIKNRAKDGKIYWVDTTIGPLLDERGKPKGYMAIRSEITQRKESEQRAAAASRYSELLLKNSPVGIATYRATGEAVAANAAVAQIIGATREQVVAQNFRQLASWKDSGLLAAAETALTTGRAQHLESRLVSTFGKRLWLAVGFIPFEHEGETHLLGQFADITERKIAEVALRDSEEAHRVLFESCYDAIVMVKAPGFKFVKANLAALRMFGVKSEAEFCQYGPKDLSPERQPDGRLSAEVAGGMAQTAMQKGSHSFEWLHRRFSGEEFHALVSLTQMEVAGQIMVLSIIRDITDRKLSEEKLQRASRQLLDITRQAGMAEVATNVLHNVGNVLNSVNVSATLVADAARKSKVVNLGKVVALLDEHAADLGQFFTVNPKGAQLTGYLRQLNDHLAHEKQVAITELDSLCRNIEHIKGIVTMQQNYAKVSGVTELIQVPDLIEEALRIDAASLKQTHVQVRREFSDLPPIQVDKYKALQILVNLIRNAKHACEDSGRAGPQLTVRASHHDRTVKIFVTDNGVGIPPENLDRIFNHGFTTKKNGHGFGLHSGANAARELGGTLTAHSDGAGRGAVFTVELPLQPPEKSNV